MVNFKKIRFLAIILCVVLCHGFVFAQNPKQVTLDLKAHTIDQPNPYDSCIIKKIERANSKDNDTIKLMLPFNAQHSVFNDTAKFFFSSFQREAAFASSTFNHGVDFSNSLFNGKTNFRGDSFNKGVDFSLTMFQKRTAFTGANFRDDAYFSGGIYQQNAAFNSIVFGHGADFSFSVFADTAGFSADSFQQFADFGSIKFWQPALFDTSVFEGEVSFINCSFNNGADFTYACFADKADFSSAFFSQKASFRNITFGQCGQLDFKWATLPDTLDFSNNSKIPNVIDLIEARYVDSLNHKTWIYLHESDLSKFRLDYTHFELLFQDPVDGTCLSRDEQYAIYEGLLKNFSDRGQLVSYEKLDRQYQRYKHYISWPLLLIWWNYGYNKELIIAWILGFMLVFTCITRFIIKGLNYKVYEVKEIEPKLASAGPLRLWWYSFVYTGIIFFSFTLNLDKLKLDKWPGVMYIIIVYTAGIICLAYGANFVLQK